MDQQVFYHFDDFDPNSVNLNALPRTVDEYMRQVQVSRINCPDVVAASVDLPKPTSSSSLAQLFNNQDEISKPCPFAPGKEWQQHFLKTFENSRKRMENLRQTIPKLDLKKLPSITQPVVWKKICLVERNPFIPISPDQVERFSCHRGTPPTTRFVLSLNDVQIDCLLKYLLTAFTEIGYTRALFEWIYALLMVIPKPIHHDTTSMLREFVQKCRKLRSELTKDDKTLIIEYTMLIVIISISFSQRDLADYTFC
uniref:Gem-associated protein 2 n=1 Tax=Panagrolaimus sp. JU765 TaxID=591449 RepID=A0AC34QAU6_9BILA